MGGQWEKEVQNNLKHVALEISGAHQEPTTKQVIVNAILKLGRQVKMKLEII